MQRVQDRQEEDARAGDARRDVAEHEQLRPPRALRPVAQVAAARRRSRATRASCAARPRPRPRRRPRISWPWVASRRLSCSDDAVHGGQVLQRVRWAARGRTRAAGAAGGSDCGALDQVALELAAQVALELAQPLARDRVGVGRVGRLLLALALQPERAPDALDVDADHAGALALAAERRDREPGQVAHLAVGALADGLADLARAGSRGRAVLVALVAAVLGERCSVSPRSTASRSTARKKKRSKRRSKTRRSSCDFASVAASAARKSSSVVHGTCSSAAKASSSSDVPTSMPSSRSSSANSSSRGAKPPG